MNFIQNRDKNSQKRKLFLKQSKRKTTRLKKERYYYNKIISKIFLITILLLPFKKQFEDEKTETLFNLDI